MNKNIAFGDELRNAKTQEALAILEKKVGIYSTLDNLVIKEDNTANQYDLGIDEAKAKAKKIEAETETLKDEARLKKEKQEVEIDIMRSRAAAENAKTMAEAEAIKLKAEAELIRAKSESEISKTEADMKYKFTTKDLVTMIPAIITGIAGVITIVSGIRQTRIRCQTDLIIAKSNNELKQAISNQLTKTNETDILIDKPLKVTNEICR